MKPLFFVILFITIINTSFTAPAPANYNNWIFGDNAGITFTTADGNPEPLEIGDNYKYREGTSSVSDENGSLLYYISLGYSASSTYLKSANSSFVEEGFSIETCYDVSNTGLFIQDFTDNTLYHLLTVSELNKNNSEGIYYYQVDSKANDGAGLITIRDKNLFKDATEKMTAVVNEIDDICWVITHELNNNTFRIIKIDKDGLDENIMTQSIGLEHKSSSTTVGTGRMNMSPSGTLLAVTIPLYDPDETGEHKGDVELFKFDPKTGKLSDPCRLYLNENTYSTAFSPNGKVLYVKVTNKIYQYDLTICDIDEMIEKRYTINTKSSDFFNAIERGPNGIIYCGRDKNNYLDAILDPNIIGEGCNYTEDVVEIGGEFMWGLPTVINSYFTGEYDDYCLVHEEERTYKVSAPVKACFGDKIDITIESEQGLDFETGMIKNDYTNKFIPYPVGPYQSENSVANFSFVINKVEDYSWPLFSFSFQITLANGDIDTVNFLIKSANCCSPFINNWNFSASSGDGYCYPIAFQTDYFFSPDSNVSCVNEIKKPGELKDLDRAGKAMYNFEKTPTTGRMIVGDPLPNVEMRAWYQNYATKIGTRYRFMASVSNVEKIERKVDHSRSLDMWIGIKNRNQELILDRVDDIKYEDDWILLSGEFTAEDNYSEFQVWTLGNSIDNDTSYGFAIDFVDLELVEEFDLIVSEDTTICVDDEFTPNNQFYGNIVDVNWEPTNGVSDATVLNPNLSPDISTKYTITLNDELGCKYIDSLFVEVDSCLPTCIPCVNYTLSDRVVELGNDYCIEGEFIPTCTDSTRKKSLSLYFEYNPNMMKFINNPTSQITDTTINNNQILRLDYSPNQYRLNEINNFELCFSSLLGGDSLTKLAVYEDSNTVERVCVTSKDSSLIKYEACILPYRQVIFLKETVLEIEQLENEFVVLLTTEELGDFKFVLTDVNGRAIEEYSFNSSDKNYKKEEIIRINFDDLSAGVYFIRMQTPNGKIKSVKFVKN